MSKRIHALAQQLFGKSSMTECDLQEIKNIVQQFPYFAPAQFLLLEKLKQENSPEYSEQLNKSILYYHNPLEFEYFISSNKFLTEINLEELDEVSEESFKEKTEAEIEIQHDHEPTPTNEIEKVTEEEKSQPKEELLISQITNPKSQTSDDLVFEPYHTVDYFASQGIKLSQEEIPKDKFGKQLKSFTEWLKIMKRLPASENPTPVDASSEKKVQHLAEDSVHESDVYTEAMAEVWLKQGNSQKALEVYNKLSLLNPSKRAYFAAKIENLKRS